MKKYLQLLRVKHWMKNAIVFLPVFFNGTIFSNLFIRSLTGFFSFSFISSCVYIINDICDADKDRLHPVKCRRPIASGIISKKSAAVAAVICGIAGLALSAVNLKSFIVVSAYFLLNIAYSFKLKHIPVADVCILASGFVLRLLLGSFVTNIEISSWLYLTLMMASFYFGFGKRRGEFKSEASEKREVLRFYTYDFVDKSTYMFLTLAIVFYSLWAISVSKVMVWSVAAVLVILLKYNLDIEKDISGDPVDVFTSDIVLIIMTSAYIIAMVLFIYFFKP